MDCKECERKEAIIKIQKDKIRTLISSVENINLMKNHLVLLVRLRNKVFALLKNKHVNAKTIEKATYQYSRDLKIFGEEIDIKERRKE